jgi:serine/threonine protein kinase
MYLHQGTVLNNRYQIESILGHGGFGVTYLARDLTLNVQVAVKEYLPRQLATRAEGATGISIYTGDAREHFDYGLKKFLAEARAVAQFADHPNIVSARDYFAANGTAYMVMRYIQGADFKAYLAQHGGKIPFDLALKIMMPVMDALRQVHAAGLLHRDISPDNIYLTADGQVKLMDFGAARQQTGEHSKSLSVILKTGYAPPEQYRSKGKQGPWTDIYATAATLYKAITGETPPEALDRLAEDTLVPPSQMGVAIPPAAEQVLLQALAVNQDRRYQTMEEFQDQLTGEGDVGLTTMVQTPAPTPTPSPSGSSRVRKGRWQAAVIAATGLVGIALVGGLLWRASITPPPTPASTKVAEGERQPGILPSSPQTVSPETRTVQDFSIPQAMELIFGNYNRDRKASRFQTLAVPKEERFAQFSQTASGVATVALMQSFREQGRDKYLVVTKTMPDGEAHSCHACAPLIGAAIFVRQGSTWEIEILEKYLTVIGAYGEPPTIRLRKIGPDKHGISFAGGDAGMGYTSQYLMIAAPVEKKIKIIFDEPVGGDNEGACDRGKADKNYWGYKVDIDFIPQPGKPFFTIRTKTTGTQKDDSAGIIPVNSDRTYVFDGDRYSPEGLLAKTEPRGVTPQEFPKKWLLDWKFQHPYKGYMVITGQSSVTNYTGRLFSKSGRNQVVSEDVTIAINGDHVFIHCSNPNVPGWSTDDFFLELKGTVMSGYSTDNKGRRGKAFFQGVNEPQFAAYLQQEFSPAASRPGTPETPKPAASSTPGDIQQVIGQFYGRVQNKDVAGAISLYAAAKIPAIKKNLIASVAKDTEYYRIESINVVENNGLNAKTQVHLFHKKYSRPEEKWYIEISLLKEAGEWRIVSTPGRKVY